MSKKVSLTKAWNMLCANFDPGQQIFVARLAQLLFGDSGHRQPEEQSATRKLLDRLIGQEMVTEESDTDIGGSHFLLVPEAYQVWQDEHAEGDKEDIGRFATRIQQTPMFHKLTEHVRRQTGNVSTTDPMKDVLSYALKEGGISDAFTGVLAGDTSTTDEEDAILAFLESFSDRLEELVEHFHVVVESAPPDGGEGEKATPVAVPINDVGADDDDADPAPVPPVVSSEDVFAQMEQDIEDGATVVSIDLDRAWAIWQVIIQHPSFKKAFKSTPNVARFSGMLSKLQKTDSDATIEDVLRDKKVKNLDLIKCVSRYFRALHLFRKDIDHRAIDLGHSTNPLLWDDIKDSAFWGKMGMSTDNEEVMLAEMTAALNENGRSVANVLKAKGVLHGGFIIRVMGYLRGKGVEIQGFKVIRSKPVVLDIPKPEPEPVPPEDENTGAGAADTPEDPAGDVDTGSTPNDDNDDVDQESVASAEDDDDDDTEVIEEDGGAPASAPAALTEREEVRQIPTEAQASTSVLTRILTMVDDEGGADSVNPLDALESLQVMGEVAGTLKRELLERTRGLQHLNKRASQGDAKSQAILAALRELTKA
jgi:hypothetical protein